MQSAPLTKKLNKVFEFLRKNYKFNHHIQRAEIKQTLLAYASRDDQMRWLLKQCVDSQTRPNLNKLWTFWKDVRNNNQCLRTYKNFRVFINRRNPNNPLATAQLLAKEDGWGDKTAALFVKKLWLASHDKDLKTLVWSDIDWRKERVYLPVDIVIENIFFRMTKKKHDFKSINKMLSVCKYNKTADMVIWDDLWFWGFITQKGTNNREFGWNEAKYWSIFTAKKDEKTIKKIQKQAKEFLRLTNSRRFPLQAITPS